MLRGVGVLADRLGKEGLRDLGSDVPVGKVTACQFMASYRGGSQLPSTSDITRADDIELQEIAEKASRSIENLKQQVQEEPTGDLPMRELLGLDAQLRSIRGSLKVEVLEYKPSILLVGPFPFHIFIIFLIWTLVVKLHDNEV